MAKTRITVDLNERDYARLGKVAEALGIETKAKVKDNDTVQVALFAFLGEGG
jgi:hypothetical protein